MNTQNSLKRPALGMAVLATLALAGCGGGGGGEDIPEQFATSAGCLDPVVLQEGTTMDVRYRWASDGPNGQEVDFLTERSRNMARVVSAEGDPVHPFTVVGRETVSTFDGHDSTTDYMAWQRRGDGTVEWYQIENLPLSSLVGADGRPAISAWDPAHGGLAAHPCEDRMWTLQPGGETRMVCAVWSLAGHSYAQTDLTRRYEGVETLDTPLGRVQACRFHESEKNYYSRYGFVDTASRVRWVVRGVDVRVEEHWSSDGETGSEVLELLTVTINGQPLVQ